MKKKISLIKIIKSGFVIFNGFMFLILIAFVIFREISTFREKRDILQEEHISIQKILIKQQVDLAIEKVNLEREFLFLRLKELVTQNNISLNRLLTSDYDVYTEFETKPNAKISEFIVAPIGNDDVSAIIFDEDKKILYNGSKCQIDNKLLNRIFSESDGYHRLNEKNGMDLMIYKSFNETSKLSIVSILDIDKKLEFLKHELLEEIGNIRFGNDSTSYVFVTTFDGVAIMTQPHLIGINIWEYTEKNGMKVVSENKKTVDGSGGEFIQYIWQKPDTEKFLTKISYIKGLPDWEWIIGAGAYIDDIEKEIQQRQRELFIRVSKFVFFSLLFFLLTIVVFLFVVRRLGREVEVDIKTILQTLVNSSTMPQSIKTQKIKIKEIDKIAGYINELLSEKIAITMNLQKSEKKYRTLFENINSGVLVLEACNEGNDFIIIDVNKTVEKLENLNRNKIIGKKVTEVFPYIKEAGLFKIFQSVYKTGKSEHQARTLYESQNQKNWRENFVYRLPNGNIVSVYDDVTQRAIMESALIRNEENFRNFFDANTDFLWVFDEEGLITDVNKTVINRLQYSQEELLGKSMLSVHSKGKDEITKRMFNEALAGEREHCDIPLLAKDGTEIPVVTSIVKGKWNNLPAFFCISKDVSAMKFSQEKFQKMFQLSPIIMGLSEWDSGKYIEVNHSFYETFGFPPKEVIGVNVGNLFKLNTKTFKMINDKLKNNGYVRNEEVIVRTKKGDTKVMSMSAEIVELYGKKYSFTTAVDFTEKKQNEGRIKKLYTAVEQSQSIIMITDLDGLIEYVNPKFCEITGYSFSEVLGQNPRMLKSGINDDMMYKDLWNKISLNGTWKGEFQNKKKNGELFCESSSISPIYDENGKKINYLKVAEDITKLKQLEEENKIFEQQRQQSQKLETVGTLAGGIAHDFNNILTPILGYSGLMRNHLDKSDELYDQAQEIFNAGMRAKDLISQILNFSRQKETKKAPLNLHLVLKEAIKLMRPTISSMIEIKENIDRDCGKVMVDSTKIHQVIVNICTNAAFAMKENIGTLSIELYETLAEEEENLKKSKIEKGRFCKMIFSDTGCGIPDKIINKIFDPFFTTKEIGEGTGLGLSVVHGIIKEHHGHIFVDSEEDQGTSFLIYLPIIEEEVNAEKEQEKENKIEVGKGNLLVIDDRVDVTNILQTMLKDFGYTVWTFNETDKAYNFFKQNSNLFDLIISDYAMPKMSGIDFINNIRELKDTIPVIFVTGDASKMSQEELEHIGNYKLINKPILTFEMSKNIRELLDN